MRSANFWHQLNLHSSKIIIILLMVFSFQLAEAQKKDHWMKRNTPEYEGRKLTYGFLIGLHTSTYQIKYSDAFTTQAFDSLYAVEPSWSPGFSLGFIMNYRLADLLDLRL